MSAIEPNQPAFGSATLCHVCRTPVDMSDFAVEHDGHVGMSNQSFTVEGHGHIILHAECATVLAMRLIHDVMNQKERTFQTPRRVVEALSKLKRENHGNS
jgi:hypothetical protein